ncbi:MAG: hypothetical protein H6815_11960 [Phycisphaeraceae bacterium]|nr:hypothetical protein [Phycisphaerales bacterium]MCB9861155.1 hypothetical protein [Phycisphaeraceae bacterium]
MTSDEASESRRAFIFDDGTHDLSPVTDLRAVFDVRTGGLTMLERFELAFGIAPAMLSVPVALKGIVRESHSGVTVTSAGEEIAPPAGEMFVLNGQCHLPLAGIDDLESGQALVEPDEHGGGFVAAVCDGPTAQLLANPATRNAALSKLDVVYTDERVLVRRLWDMRALRDLCIDVDLSLTLDVLFDSTDEGPGLPEGVTIIGDHRVWIDPNAVVYPTVVIDAQDGPVYIAGNATARPGSVLVGPCWIGSGSTIIDRSIIRAHTAIGPVCKVAGEITGTVFQGYSNKAHDGFLGDSWVGQWVNLGAGTTNSNLLNTYAEIPIQQHPGGSRERSGQTFFGCVLGDHTKTAICTRIMTGAIVHTGTMWARTEPMAGAIASFSWATDAGVRTFRFEKFVETMRAAMQRRNHKPSDAELARLNALFDAGVSA